MPDVHLILVGKGRLECYERALHLLARELNLQHAQLPGWVTRKQLAAHYRHADVFVTMSEHEGMCVPLIEAMSFDVPVVARAFGAIPETMGDAGVLLPPEDVPVLVAEALAEVLGNQSLRSDLVRRGRERLTHVDPQRAQATFLGHLLDAVGTTVR